MKEIELLAADAEGRRCAQTRFEETVVIEAGAGTGKTTTLVARVLAWSLGQGWDRAVGQSTDSTPDQTAAEVLHGLVAITFTEAGAAEMATRVAAALAHLASARPEPIVGFDRELLAPAARANLGARAHHLLGALDHLTVETIHAFCRGLLTSAPLEAGLHPELRVDPDLRLTEEIVHEVADEAVRQAYAKPRGQAIADLAEGGVGPDLLVEILLALRSLGLESRALTADPLSEEILSALLHRLVAAVERLRELAGRELRRVTSGNKAAAIADALDRTSARLATASAEVADIEALESELEGMWSGHLSKLGSWRRGRFTQGESVVLEPLGESFPASVVHLRSVLRHFTQLRPRRLDLARRAVAPLLAECERRAAARGVVTFADLLALAYRLLADHPPTRRRERRRIRQLLIDEFQDTEPLQCEIIRLLALSGPKNERPGLFLVGDPKQSIFGWRDADLAAYDGFVEEALEAGGERHPLVRNFRSDEPILAEVSAVVEPIMIEAPGLQPPFVELQSTHPGSRLDHPAWKPVEYWVSWSSAPGTGGPSTATDQAMDLEARAIARDVRDLHREAGVRWSDVALLFRATTRMDAYLDAFRNHDVPFIVTRDKHYYRRKEIIDAAALVRTIVDPLDHVALVAWLRSATVGVPDAAWLPLWQSDLPRLATALNGPRSPALAELTKIASDLPRRLSSDIPGLDRIRGWERNLVAAFEVLAELRRSNREDPASLFLDAVRARTLIEVSEAARYQGKFRLANLDRFFRRLESAMAERGNDMQAILRTLRRSLNEAPDAQEAPPKDCGEDAVQVLTIHKAKGLEFDHVYLPQMHAQHRRQSELPQVDIDRRWRTADEPQYCLLSAATLRWNEVADRTRDVEAMESVRLLYVAMTRARRRLVLLGNWPAVPEARPATRARAQLDLVHSRAGLPEDILELADQCATADRSWIDLDEIRWRFLGAAPPPDEIRESEAEPGWLPTVAAVAAEADDLERRRAAAGRRVARPRNQAASSSSAAKLAAVAEVREAPDERRGEPSITRDAAMFVGTAIHRVFEEWELDADPEAELAAAAGKVTEWLARWLPPGEIEGGVERARALLERFAHGSLWKEWLRVKPSIVARELPLLAPPAPDDEALDAVVGSIDLLYRDPGSDEWVVVDFKTDAVEGAELIARAEIYEDQEAVYARAVQQALGLEESPRTELWFLWADRVWRTS